MHGYRDAVESGRLDDGAHDFGYIHQFFHDAGFTLVGMEPDDAMAGDDPSTFKVLADDRRILVYAQNPDTGMPETADVSNTNVRVLLQVPSGRWSVRWFEPTSGRWHDPKDSSLSGGASRDLHAPFRGDAVLLLERND